MLYKTFGLLFTVCLVATLFHRTVDAFEFA